MPSPKNRSPRQFSPSFKAQIVAACQQPGASVARVSQAHAINANIVHRWLREHQHGVQWYDMTGRQPRKGYTAEFKRRIVEQCLQPGARVTEVACAHHISANTVHERVATHRAQTPEIDDWLPVVVAQESACAAPLVTDPVEQVAPVEPVRGHIDIEIGGARIQLHGAVDCDVLRLVLASLR